MSDLIDRQAAIDALDNGAELIKRALDEMNIVGNEREKFTWGLGLLESCIDDLKELPSAQPEGCDTCKHGYFGNKQCTNCSVRFTSHYERRTDERSD